MHIIDISRYNKIVDWSKLKNNISGAILRIGYRGYGKNGTLNIDSKFNEYLSKCISLNIPYGIYFVTQAITEKESLNECTFIEKHVDTSDCKLGVWLDSEYSTEPKHNGRYDLISKTQRTAFANVFLNYFNQKNILCGVYAGDYWLRDMMVKNDLSIKRFWVPRYGKNDGTISKKPENDFYMHQFTSKGKIDGINGDVDLSYLKDSGFFELPKLNGYGLKLSEALAINGYDNSYEFRKKIATKLGIQNYSGTAEQNIKIIELLR